MKRNHPFSYGTTISRRLLICFLVSTLIPTILTTAVLCFQFSHNFRKTAQEQMQVSQDLIVEYVTSYLNEVDTITTAPYYHTYFSSRESLSANSSDHLVKLLAFQEEMQNLINLTTFSHSDISDLVILSEGQYLYQMLFNELWYTSDKPSVEEQSWYLHAPEGNGRTVFTPTHSMPDPRTEPDTLIDTSSFYVSRKIRNLKQPDQTNLIALNMTSRHFDNNLKNQRLLYDSFILITNEQNELIYSGQSLPARVLPLILDGDTFRYDGSRWRCLSTALDDFPLRIHIVYSLNELAHHTAILILTAFFIYLLGLGIASLLYHYLNRWITRSAETLQATFTQLENGNLNAHCPPVGVEEFNRIGNSVNAMIAKLNEYIKNEYLMTIQQKSVQLYALKSQIQPHFLINTIYCFIALNQIGEKEKLNSGFYSLAHLMRYVLSKERFTTIGKELSFLEDYLKLQKLRFADRLNYQIDCLDEYREQTIPSLLLQPLVENAIIHGIEPCEHPCLCRLHVFRRDDFLYIRIEDDGVGFDPEELARKSAEAAERALHPDASVSADTQKKSKTSVGLYYVTERLKLWSEQASFTLRCEEITYAEIKIPWEVTCHETSDC